MWKISASTTGGERTIGIGNRSGNIALDYGYSPIDPFRVSSLVRRRGPFYWWVMPDRVRWDNVRKTLWMIGYDRRTTGAAGETNTNVYFPAWMLIVLCGIAPSLWLRRHLRQRSERTQRGFAVEPSAVERSNGA